jgi:hypothetical protein
MIEQGDVRQAKLYKKILNPVKKRRSSFRSICLLKSEEVVIISADLRSYKATPSSLIDKCGQSRVSLSGGIGYD